MVPASPGTLDLFLLTWPSSLLCLKRALSFFVSKESLLTSQQRKLESRHQCDKQGGYKTAVSELVERTVEPPVHIPIHVVACGTSS